MNKVNYVVGAYPDDIQMNRTQDSAESSIMDLAKAVAGEGVFTGLSLKVVESGIEVSQGLAFDNLGRGLNLRQSVVITLNDITPPSLGLLKWITVGIVYKRKTYGETYDISNVQHPLFLDDDIEIVVVEGNPGRSNDILRPNIDAVILGDFIVGSDLSVLDTAFSLSRRVVISPLSRAIYSRVVEVNTEDFEDITFESLSIPEGRYIVVSSVKGNNRWMQNVTTETIEGGIRLYLKHFSDGDIRLGSPAVRVGESVVGDFVVGAANKIKINLLLKLEG